MKIKNREKEGDKTQKVIFFVEILVLHFFSCFEKGGSPKLVIVLKVIVRWINCTVYESYSLIGFRFQKKFEVQL